MAEQKPHTFAGENVKNHPHLFGRGPFKSGYVWNFVHFTLSFTLKGLHCFEYQHVNRYSPWPE